MIIFYLYSIKKKTRENFGILLLMFSKFFNEILKYLLKFR